MATLAQTAQNLFATLGLALLGRRPPVDVVLVFTHSGNSEHGFIASLPKILIIMCESRIRGPRVRLELIS